MELTDKPHHYTDLALAIVESLNPEHHVTWYVKDCYRYMIVNGMILNIVEGNGKEYRFKEKIC